MSMFKYAYEMDEILTLFEGASTCEDFTDAAIKQRFNKFKKLVAQLLPLQDTKYDSTWSFWISLPTGSFQHYLTIVAKEEGVKPVEIEEDLRFTWDCEYPETTKWYQLHVNKSKSANDFSLNFSEYFVAIDKQGNLRGCPEQEIKQQYELLDFIYAKLEIIIQKISKSPTAYLQYIEKNLPKSYRFGRIKRHEYWDAIGIKNQFVKDLGVRRIKQFGKIAPQLKDGELLPNMTASDYFRYCAIGYGANKYERIKDKVRPVEKYKAMADMRDEGLTKIKSKSKKAFADWYHNDSRRGGHPWEICRGGNSTHISLYVSSVDNEWKLILAGSSSGRVAETVKMALALYDNEIVVQLAAAEEILKMLTGEDYVGFVPRGVTPRYCASCFPEEEEDDIISFEDPWMLESQDFEKIYPCIH